MRKKYIHRAPFLLFFLNSINSESFETLDKFYEDAKDVWYDDFKFAIVVVGGVFTSDHDPDDKNKFSILMDF